MIDAKTYLMQVELYDMHINHKLEELTRLKTLTTQITSSIKPVAASGSGSQDKLGNTIAKIIDLEAEINEAVDTFIDKRQEASKLVDKVTNTNQLQVLHKRYFEYKPWEQIACEMHMTYRNVCYIHGRALQTVGKLLEEKESEQCRMDA